MKGVKAPLLVGLVLLLFAFLVRTAGAAWLKQRRRKQHDNEPIRGELTDDPALRMTGGEKLHFTTRLIRHGLGSGAGALREMDTFDGLLLHMQFHDSEGHRIDGSAVLVAPGIALCATHVVRPYIDALVAGTATGFCMGIAKSGLQIWQLHQGTPVPDTDLTIISLTYRSSLPDDCTFSQANLTTRLPRVGEQLTLVGFRADSAELEDRTFVARASVLVCVGQVTAQYPKGRDSVMIPWPALEVDCQAWGGMSGGPVFDTNGYVVGIVCTSVGDHTVGSPAYVSLLWPAMTQQYQGGWPSQSFLGSHSLLALGRTACPIERPEAIKLTQNEGSVIALYDSWS